MFDLSQTLSRIRAYRESGKLCLSAGWPCQDISIAGRGTGLSGERSGLWRFVVRAIRLVRPDYAVLENVAELLNRGMGEVQGDLAECGYDTEWDCLPASFVGAPHLRKRIWIIAYPQSVGLQGERPQGEQVATLYGGQAISLCGSSGRKEWKAEPRVGRVVHGVHTQLDKSRIRALGNSVVPQVAEIPFAAIRMAESKQA